MAFFGGPARVVVIEMEGAIGRRIRAETHLPLLARARQSRRAGAVVLALDTPGGSAPLSEELYLAVRRLAGEKPVVVYVRGMAASGGMYVAAAAHKVVAIRTALVGSIGVIMARASAQELLQKAGISFSVHKSGLYKDMFSPWRAPTEEEARKLQALTDEVYGRFIEVVAEGRRLPADQVRAMATGEVFTAQRGRDLGLVDELGDLDRAVDIAAEMARIQPRVQYLRPKRPMFPLLRGGIGQEVAAAFLDELDALAVGRLRL